MKRFRLPASAVIPRQRAGVREMGTSGKTCRETGPSRLRPRRGFVRVTRGASNLVSSPDATFCGSSRRASHVWSVLSRPGLYGASVPSERSSTSLKLVTDVILTIRLRMAIGTRSYTRGYLSSSGLPPVILSLSMPSCTWGKGLCYGEKQTTPGPSIPRG